MQVESVGHRVAPSPVIVRLTPGDVLLIEEIARKRDEFRGYSRRPDQWGRGFLRTMSPTKVGLLGEHATATWLNRNAGCRLSVDADPKPWGDDGTDLQTDGIGIQVKTRATAKRNMFRRLDGRGRLRPMRCDLFVFCRYASDREIHLLGWLKSHEVTRMAKNVKSPVGNHWNLVVEDYDLTTIRRLVDEIEVRRSM